MAGVKRKSESGILSNKDAEISSASHSQLVSDAFSMPTYIEAESSSFTSGSVYFSSTSDGGSWNSRSVSTNFIAKSSSSSALSWISFKPTSSIFQLKTAPWIPTKRKGSKVCRSSTDIRKPVLLKRVPFGKSSKYLTVYVGARLEKSVKFVISRTLLTHPLFQVLLKCSEDEFGEDYPVKKGVALVCDPALFLQVVRAVEESLRCERKHRVSELDR